MADLPPDAAPMGNSLVLERPMRVGIVGCSVARARYGPALATVPALTVAGLVDEDTHLARAWAREIGGKIPVLAGLPALVAAAPDALLLATPLPERSTHLEFALRHGLPVLSEAPFADSLAQTDQLLAPAEEQKILLLPAFPRRFDATFQALAAQLAFGAIGAVRQARCAWSFPVGGAATLASGGDVGSWGELLQSIACQTADVCRWWLGNAQSVSADIDLPTTDRMPNRTAGGRQPREAVMANIIVTHEGGQATHHLAQSRAQLPSESYVVTGEKGRLELIVSAGERASTLELPSLTLHRPGHRPELIPPVAESVLSPSAARAQRLLTYFVQAVRTRSETDLHAADARAALEIVHAAFLSTRDGNKITLPLRRSPDIKGTSP